MFYLQGKVIPACNPKTALQMVSMVNFTDGAPVLQRRLLGKPFKEFIEVRSLFKPKVKGNLFNGLIGMVQQPFGFQY